MDVDLTGSARTLLSDERNLISDLRALLARIDGTTAEVADLKTALEDLDGVFMLVVAGEYNAGKSTLLNALLGQQVMSEGVTPTTDRITILTYGEERRDMPLGKDVLQRSWPIELLRDVAIVDTPGTNAIIREHQELTEKFIPRADLVLFVTSADRPFTESERQFLELISGWGKKVLLIVNKVDILENDEERARVVEFVTQNAVATLGVTPPVFTVRARQALRARQAGSDGQLQDSGLPEIEAFIRNSLADEERFRLKLLSPLGVAEHIAQRTEVQLGQRLELLAGDRRTLDDIDRQRQQFDRDIRRELEHHLVRFKTVLLEVESRGDQFFDDTVQWRNVLGLMNSERIREQFEARVIRGADREIDAAVGELVDWFIQRNLQLWEDVMDFVSERSQAGDEGRVMGSVGGRFQYDREALIRSLRERAESVMDTYNQRTEAVRLAESLQGAVVQSGLMQVGGLGLGAAVLAFVTGAAFDVTGITLGLTIMGLGLMVLPRRRAQAKKELHEKMLALREGLTASLTEQVNRELERSNEKLSGAIAPYTRFVRSELERLESLREELAGLAGGFRSLRQRLQE
jgi:small GTP-binding protein